MSVFLNVDTFLSEVLLVLLSQLVRERVGSRLEPSVSRRGAVLLTTGRMRGTAAATFSSMVPPTAPASLSRTATLS